MSKLAMVLVASLALAAAACGSETQEPRVDPPAGDADPSVRTVSLSISSPLPTALTTDCAQGDVAELGASLWIAPAGVCALTVSAAGVSGTCADVVADGHRTLSLVYEVEASGIRLAQQVRIVLLDATSPDVVPVSFAGVSVDEPFGSNLTDWCNGTL